MQPDLHVLGDRQAWITINHYTPVTHTGPKFPRGFSSNKTSFLTTQRWLMDVYTGKCKCHSNHDGIQTGYYSSLNHCIPEGRKKTQQEFCHVATSTHRPRLEPLELHRWWRTGARTCKHASVGSHLVRTRTPAGQSAESTQQCIVW